MENKYISDKNIEKKNLRKIPSLSRNRDMPLKAMLGEISNSSKNKNDDHARKQ